jgi:hypothetical protein
LGSVVPALDPHGVRPGHEGEREEFTAERIARMRKAALALGSGRGFPAGSLQAWERFEDETMPADVLSLLDALEEAQHEAAEWKEQAFRPMGDNHHNAALCPYCSPRVR